MKRTDGDEEFYLFVCVGLDGHGSRCCGGAYVCRVERGRSNHARCVAELPLEERIRRYFVNVTNELLSVSQPLLQLEVGSESE